MNQLSSMLVKPDFMGTPESMGGTLEPNTEEVSPERMNPDI